MSKTKEYIVDVISIRVDFPEDVSPDSILGSKMILEELGRKVNRGENICEYFEVDEELEIGK